MNRHLFSRLVEFLAVGPLAFFPLGGSGSLLADQTRIAAASRTLPMAPLGPLNPWPQFRFQNPPNPVHVPADFSAEDREGTFADSRVSMLPYLMQDSYTRQRQSGSLPTVVAENAALRATFYPTLGGRMISLYDKAGRRELLFDNPVLQFANLAIRNAWFSGGVEWNGPVYGHTPLTCSPVFAGIVATPRGPLLRLYEFDRALETTWQVDVFLPNSDDRLWVHVKAVNPNAHAVRLFWWTNLAVPLTRETRVLSPADYAIGHVVPGNIRLSFPLLDGFDASYPFNHSPARSVFFRKPGNQRPWSVCLDGQGQGLCHVSTSTLFGRKLFTWGQGRGGKRWMDFLSEDGRGDYIEIQGGITPTQLQTRPLAAGASIEWTECISAFAMDRKAAHDPDYSVACGAAAKVIDQRVSEAALKEIDAFLTAQADVKVQTLLRRGAGWGWLHEKRMGRKLSPGLLFEAHSGDEEQPWTELLTIGTFSPQTLGRMPCSYNVSEGWTDKLRESARAHGATWLHHFHLGVAKLEKGEAGAAECFESSLALKDNAPARRCLALLHAHRGDSEAAEAFYMRAWKLCKNDPNLAVEIADFFNHHKRYAEFDAFVKSLPPPIADHERIALVKAQIALDRGEYATVRRLLRREYCTIREGEVSLTDLWFDSYIKEAEKRDGRKLTPAETRKLEKQFPPPREIDFQMNYYPGTKDPQVLRAYCKTDWQSVLRAR